MKKLSKAILLVTFLVIGCPSVWSQASPSTEGRDFWVTFLQKNQDAKSEDKKLQELKLTISAPEACRVTISHPNLGTPIVIDVADNSSTEIGTLTKVKDINGQDKTLTDAHCYSTTSEAATKTALHVTATKDISLFAGNYLPYSFDASNILPTSALLDDYMIQTFPPSDHEDKSQGSHFAIVAVEDGTVVDYVLTAKTKGGKTGKQQTNTLNKGEVWYVWTGRGSGDDADLSGTTVKARDGKKIAVFQGCVHTNIPDKVRDRDHIFSQAMPTAYWGTEFGITASRMHRRDIVAVMALNDGTQVYINAEDGGKQLVHTFDFSKDKKHYWTFEMGESLAYCADDEAPSYGRLPDPLWTDSSCYLTTSCPAGVHLFMVSNRYDNLVTKVSADTLVDDPAMLWISPIEQVIKEINFATYKTKDAKCHFMNIVTAADNVASMKWNNNSIAQHFHLFSGDTAHAYARIEIPNGTHNLKGAQGFLAHVYGYGKRESYAYSCGSSTIQRGLALNGTSIDVGGFASNTYCVDKEINMKLNIGNNDYQKIVWDYGDGISYSADITASNEKKTTTSHTYTVPGWYDLTVSAEFINECTNKTHKEDMHFSFYVDRPDTLYRNVTLCADSVPNYHFDEIPNSHPPFAMQDSTVDEIIVDTITSDGDCSNVYILTINAVSQRLDTIDLDKVYPIAQRRDSALIPADGYDNGEGLGLYHPTAEYVYTGGYYVRHYYRSNTKCDSTVTYHVTVVKCLDLKAENTQQTVCYMDSIHNLTFSYDRDGNPGSMDLWIDGKKNCPIIFGDKDSKVDDGVSRIHISASAVPDKVYPGYHKAVIKMEDKNCDTIAESEPFNLTVLYPDSIFAYKFDNVLTMYKKGHGGNIPGWDFARYEWYHNDDTIPCGTGPVYHTDEPFTIGDTYYVVLTRTDGMVLRSCEFEIQNHGGIERSGKGNAPDSDGNDTGNMPAANAPAKFIQNRQLYILFEGAVYNMYGQRVKSND